jgi:hypothetical protein
MKKNKDNLYDYYFHFNHLTGYWNAIPRDSVNEYMSTDKNEDKILKNKNLNDLVKYIINNE